MKMQMVDVVGQYQKIKTEVDAAIHRVLDSGQFIMGKEVGELETHIASYLGVPRKTISGEKTPFPWWQQAN